MGQFVAIAISKQFSPGMKKIDEMSHMRVTRLFNIAL